MPYDIELLNNIKNFPLEESFHDYMIKKICEMQTEFIDSVLKQEIGEYNRDLACVVYTADVPQRFYIMYDGKNLGSVVGEFQFSEKDYRTSYVFEFIKGKKL